MPSKHKNDMDISIIIPYNKERKYLKEAIESCENQDFSGSYEIILQQGDHWTSKNRNDAIKKAKGEYIKLLDDDDILIKSALTDLYKNTGDSDLIVGNYLIMHDNKIEQYKCEIQNTVSNMVLNYSLGYGAILYKKQSIIDAGFFDETYKTCEDFEFNVRLASLGYKFSKIEKDIFIYRTHINQKSDCYYSINGEWIKYRFGIKKQIINSYKNNYSKIYR